MSYLVIPELCRPHLWFPNFHDGSLTEPGVGRSLRGQAWREGLQGAAHLKTGESALREYERETQALTPSPSKKCKHCVFFFICLLLNLNQGKGSGPLSQEVETRTRRRSVCVTL